MNATVSAGIPQHIRDEINEKGTQDQGLSRMVTCGKR
jgi:hypothetical protein